ncbi:MAG TPA: Ig-like domain-containing protein [Candidatus Saccharimonadales bacterium]
MFKRVRLLLGAVGVFTAAVSVLAGTPFASAATPTPTLTSPVTGGLVGRNIPVQFTLPVTPATNSVKLIFVGASTYTITLTTATSGTTNFTLSNGVNLLPDSHISSISPAVSRIPDGNYSVTLSYQNQALDPAATSTATNVTLDTTPPTPTNLSPTNNQTSVAVNSPLVITLSEPGFLGANTIEIRKTADNSLVESLPVSSSSQLSGSGTNTITITPTTLQPNTAYTVSIPSGAFFDAADNGSTAFSWQFTTAAVAVAGTAATTTPTTPQLADTGFHVWVLEACASSLILATIIVRLFPRTLQERS